MARKPATKKPAPKRKSKAKVPRKPGNTRGPLPWKPTAEELEQISTYAGLGMLQEDIGRLMGKSVDSLDRRARDAMDTGTARANALIAGSLFTAAQRGEGWAVIWWEKTRSGKKDVTKHEHSGPDGKPIPYSDMSDAEIDARLAAKLKSDAA